ncbi:uncharacterized protein LOC110931331 [Helianthus annuus]|uniref:uncharacterized protein LOC110931331 n=1 Tax=Helianthus annuus TaxID=4232 RepID=UPI001652CFD7|nr:uncharacterized protein LOC110931331 [Helianthus annuus]
MDAYHTNVVDCETSSKKNKPKFLWNNDAFMEMDSDYSDSDDSDEEYMDDEVIGFKRFVQESFNHFGETIHRHFYRVLAAVLRMSADIIKPAANYNDDVPAHILNNPPYYPMFKNCIGAIDGTHVRASAQLNEQSKSLDAYEACTRRRSLWDEDDVDYKYYVVDVGYPNTRGYLAPYKASMAIHNYIRKVDGFDKAFDRAQQESYSPRGGGTSDEVREEVQSTRRTNDDDMYMADAYRV